MSGMAIAGPTMPGRWATFATCWTAWSPSSSRIRRSSAKMSPSVRIPPCLGTRHRYASMRSTSMLSVLASGLHVEHDRAAEAVRIGPDLRTVVRHRLHFPHRTVAGRVEPLAQDSRRPRPRRHEPLRVVEREDVAQEVHQPLAGVRARGLDRTLLQGPHGTL